VTAVLASPVSRPRAKRYPRFFEPPCRQRSFLPGSAHRSKMLFENCASQRRDREDARADRDHSAAEMGTRANGMGRRFAVCGCRSGYRVQNPGSRGCHVKLLNVGDTWGRAIAIRACFEAAINSSIRAMREIRESIEGKAPQRFEITGPERKEITLRVVHDRESEVPKSRRDYVADSTEVSLSENKPM
jgi:hypothetical protein